MTDQPFTLEQLVPGRFGGPRIEEPFEAGWAMFAFRGERGHWWRRIKNPPAALPRVAVGGRVDYYLSLCGLDGVSTERVRPFTLGDMAPCKLCMRKAPRGPNSRDRQTFLERGP